MAPTPEHSQTHAAGRPPIVIPTILRSRFCSLSLKSSLIPSFRANSGMARNMSLLLTEVAAPKKQGVANLEATLTCNRSLKKRR
jgi:hypothetical protein